MGVQPICKKHSRPFHPIFPVELLKCLPRIANSFAERLKTNSTSEGISYIVYIIGISEGKKGCVQCFSVNSALNKKTSFFA